MTSFSYIKILNFYIVQDSTDKVGGQMKIKKLKTMNTSIKKGMVK